MTTVWEGRRVLVPVTQGRRDLAVRLENLGVVVTEVECIVIAPPHDAGALHDAVHRWCAGDYAWMALTSRNALLAMRRAATAQGEDLAAATAKVATVGEATERVCRAAGLNIELVPVRADARGLVAEFPHAPVLSEDPVERSARSVLVPLGNLASPVLARGLERKGWLVDVVEAYRTVDGPGLTPDVVGAVANGEFDAILLTSSSVAERIGRDLGVTVIPKRTAVVAIGETTAAGARGVGLRPHAVSTVPSHDGILEALAVVFEEVP